MEFYFDPLKQKNQEATTWGTKKSDDPVVKEIRRRILGTILKLDVEGLPTQIEQLWELILSKWQDL